MTQSEKKIEYQKLLVSGLPVIDRYHPDPNSDALFLLLGEDWRFPAPSDPVHSPNCC